ncbi:MAG: nitrogenase [Clostridia bacterium]|nr:nitrogenase [Clostridia bacterium]
MGYIDEKVVPKREERLKACNAFGGKACQLIEGSRGGCLVNKNRSFSQTCNCQMGLALAMVLTIPEAVTIMHGPIGCGSSSHNMDSYFRPGQSIRGGKPKALLWVSTNLEEQDIIGGGESKLEEAIIKADQNHRPAAIIVVSSCAPGIIGDDIDELTSRLQKRISARIIPIHCEGFKTKISATAYDAVYHGIARSLELELKSEAPGGLVSNGLDQVKKEYIKSKTVNVLNVFSMGRTDELEIERLLKALGLEVNFYPNFAHPDKFRFLIEAALNISVCPTHDDYFVEILKERYGIPYVLNNMPIGIRNTEDWLLDIAKELNLESEAKTLIEKEKKELEVELELYRSILKGKRVLVSGGEIRVAVTAMLLQELGCEVVGIRAYHYDQFGDDIYLKAVSGNPDLEINVATTQVFELVNMLKKVKPDLFVGHSGSNVWAAKLGIPALPLFSQPQNYVGYRGVFEVAKRAARIIKNTAFQRTFSENVTLPFKEDWYGKSPFTYITEK